MSAGRGTGLTASCRSLSARRGIDSPAPVLAGSEPAVCKHSTERITLTKKDLAAINDGLRAYRELLPLMREPSNIEKVSDAIKRLEELKARA